MLGGIGKVLSQRDFAIYWASNGVNTVGRWMYRIAVAWLAWELTESTVWLGIVAFAESIPLVIFSVVAGALADRVGYIRITILAQTATAVAAVIFAAMTLLGLMTIELVVVFALLIGTLESLTTPARMALVHALVPKDHLAAAIGLTGATFNGSRFVGPAIAGILISVSGSGVVLAVVAATFTQFCIALLAIKVQEPERKPGPWRDIFGDMATGIKYGFTHPGIRFLLIMLGITGLLIRPVIELMPGFAAQVFDSGSDGFAILMSAIGFGAMVSCLWVGMRGRTEGLTNLVTISLLIQGIGLVLSTQAGQIWIATISFAVVGFAMLVGGVGSQTLIQNAVESDVRARVMSLFIVISWGLPAFGALAAGWIASFAGMEATIAAGGVLTVALWIWARPQAIRLRSDLEKQD
ncbi:MAG: MFS transporter [Alphaproteobacteria bacterium]|jgi:MFS family permease|nr:MFS transporter [Alphaproteobacteria bacterium]